MHLRSIKRILEELQPYREAQLEGINRNDLLSCIAKLDTIYKKLTEEGNSAEVITTVNEARQQLIQFQNKELDTQAQSEPYNTVHLVLLILSKCWPLGNNLDEDGSLECPLSQEKLTSKNSFMTSLGTQFDLQHILDHFESNSEYKKHNPVSREPFNKKDLALAKAQANKHGVTSRWEQQYHDQLTQHQIAATQQANAMLKHRDLIAQYHRQRIARLKKYQKIDNTIVIVSGLVAIVAASLFILYGWPLAMLLNDYFMPVISGIPYSAFLLFSSAILITGTAGGLVLVGSFGLFDTLLVKLHTLYNDMFLPPMREPIQPLGNAIQPPRPVETIQPAPAAYLKRVMEALANICEDIKSEPRPAAPELKSSNALMQIRLSPVAEVKQPLPPLALDLGNAEQRGADQGKGMMPPYREQKVEDAHQREGEPNHNQPRSNQGKQRLAFLNSLNKDGTKKSGSPAVAPQSPGSRARAS